MSDAKQPPPGDGPERTSRHAGGKESGKLKRFDDDPPTRTKPRPGQGLPPPRPVGDGPIREDFPVKLDVGRAGVHVLISFIPEAEGAEALKLAVPADTARRFAEHIVAVVGEIQGKDFLLCAADYRWFSRDERGKEGEE